MLVDFFYKLRSARLPVSLTEYLSLLEAMRQHVASNSVDDFYFLSRAALVKDERHYDRFDQVFGAYFKGMEELFDEVVGEIPEEWLRKQAELMLTEEEKAQIEAMGGWEKLMETLKERLEEQKGRHQGGNKWIGTAGKSPFGAYGYNPEGVRIGQHESRNRRAVKVWDKREYKNLDDTVEIGTRNIKVALRKLRRFAREGAADELTSTTPSVLLRETPDFWTSRWCQSATTRLRFCCFWTSAAQWTTIFASVKSCSPRREASLNISSITTSTTVYTNTCGKIIVEDTLSGSRPQRS